MCHSHSFPDHSLSHDWFVHLTLGIGSVPGDGACQMNKVSAPCSCRERDKHLLCNIMSYTPFTSSKHSLKSCRSILCSSLLSRAWQQFPKMKDYSFGCVTGICGIWLRLFYSKGDSDVRRWRLCLLLLRLQLQGTWRSSTRLWTSGGTNWYFLVAVAFFISYMSVWFHVLLQLFVFFSPQHAAREEILANGGSLSHHHGGSATSTHQCSEFKRLTICCKGAFVLRV